ncbi:MAG: hypothetical protein ACRC06_12575 [Waterburya sp.]
MGVSTQLSGASPMSNCRLRSISAGVPEGLGALLLYKKRKTRLHEQNRVFYDL